MELSEFQKWLEDGCPLPEEERKRPRIPPDEPGDPEDPFYLADTTPFEEHRIARIPRGYRRATLKRSMEMGIDLETAFHQVEKEEKLHGLRADMMVLDDPIEPTAKATHEAFMRSRATIRRELEREGYALLEEKDGGSVAIGIDMGAGPDKPTVVAMRREEDGGFTVLPEPYITVTKDLYEGDLILRFTHIPKEGKCFERRIPRTAFFESELPPSVIVERELLELGVDSKQAAVFCRELEGSSDLREAIFLLHRGQWLSVK